MIFSIRSSVFEAHFQELSTLRKVKIPMGNLVQSLTEFGSFSTTGSLASRIPTRKLAKILILNWNGIYILAMYMYRNNGM